MLVPGRHGHVPFLRTYENWAVRRGIWDVGRVDVEVVGRDVGRLKRFHSGLLGPFVRAMVAFHRVVGPVVAYVVRQTVVAVVGAVVFVRYVLAGRDGRCEAFAPGKLAVAVAGAVAADGDGVDSARRAGAGTGVAAAAPRRRNCCSRKTDGSRQWSLDFGRWDRSIRTSVGMGLARSDMTVRTYLAQDTERVGPRRTACSQRIRPVVGSCYNCWGEQAATWER